jgi:hypothetical protein
MQRAHQFGCAAWQGHGNVDAEAAVSLFCFAVSRTTGYETDLMNLQATRRVGIFACDAHAVLSTDPLTLQDGTESLHFAPAPVGQSKDGTSGNTKLFINAWSAIAQQGLGREQDFTVKVDPDAVLLPDRLRQHLRPARGYMVYVRNCNKFPDSPNFPMMFGAIEILSRSALAAYFNGMARCESKLLWQSWGEDLYLGRCLIYLGVRTGDDFKVMVDGLCDKGSYGHTPVQISCVNNVAAAFHPVKTAAKWDACWKQATAATGPEALVPMSLSSGNPWTPAWLLPDWMPVD